MNITFAPVDEAFIKAKVAEGYYSNATEIVRDAIRRLREKDGKSDGHERLRAAIQRGMDSFETGKPVKFDKNYMKKTENRIRKLAAQGGSFDFDPDVVGPENQKPWA